MSEKTEIEYSLLINAENAYGEIRKMEIICFRLLGMVQRFSGGDPNLQNMIAIIQKTIMWVRHLQMTIHAFEVASGPLGWVYAAVMAGSFAMTTGDMMADSIRTAS